MNKDMVFENNYVDAKKISTKQVFWKQINNDSCVNKYKVLSCNVIFFQSMLCFVCALYLKINIIFK